MSSCQQDIILGGGEHNELHGISVFMLQSQVEGAMMETAQRGNVDALITEDFGLIPNTRHH